MSTTDLWPLEARITSRIAVGPQGCWLWTGSANPKGYGLASFNGKQRTVMGALYEAFEGPVPKGMVLDHYVCDTPACVNPDHLRPVTPRENILRGNGPTALNAAKTHCPAGHPYDEENTYQLKTGGRMCRTCARERIYKRRHPQE